MTVSERDIVLAEAEEASGKSVEGTTIASTATEPATQTNTFTDLVARTAWQKANTKLLRDDTNDLHSEVARLHGETLERLLRHRTTEKTQHDVRHILEDLAERGFGWSAIARIVGVSAPALRKWRRGEPASGGNRRGLAEFAAACEIVSDRNPTITDVAGWLEVPLSGSAPVTGIDLLAAHRYDLVFRYADGEEDPEVILDDFEPDWRETYASNIEVFTADDGMPALRMRNQD